MTLSVEEQLPYEGTSPRAYEHPADRAATAALAAIPLMDTVLKRLSDLGYERQLRQVLLGSAVRLGDSQLPSVWSGYCRSARLLDVEQLPELYITQTPLVNALTIGARSPVVLVYSGLVSDLTTAETDAVLAHELGHVVSEHTYYRTALMVLAMLTTRALPSLAGLPVDALVLVLQEWARAAELSADRAAALAAGDPMLMCKTLMRLAGGAHPELNIDAFITQATSYEHEEDLFARWSRARIELRVEHPFAVRRVRELIDWVRDGDYDRIRAGTYVRRGQEPPATQEFNQAVAHYRDRFTMMVSTAFSSVQRLASQLDDWMKDRRQADPDSRPFSS